MKKIALICLTPDSGHIVPLLRIAKIAREEGFQVTCFVPDEAALLIEQYGFSRHTFGPVLPPDSNVLLSKLSSRKPIFRHLIYNNLFEGNYFRPLQIASLSHFEQLRDSVKTFNPSLILGDDHLFGGAILSIANFCNAPVILNQACGSNFRCQVSPPPWVSKPWYPRKTLLDFSGRLIGYLEAKWTKLANKKEWERRREQYSVLKKYWSNFERESHSQRQVKKCHIAAGLGALEQVYLSDYANICTEFNLLGALPPITEAELPEKVKVWLDHEKHRPILFVCFGTMIIPSKKEIKSILNAASILNVRVLWVSRTNPFIESRSTLLPLEAHWESWLPLPKIIEHPSVKVFLTHAGSGAMQEALWFAKPVICVPHLWDQSYNAWVAEMLGFGIRIENIYYLKFAL